MVGIGLQHAAIALLGLGEVVVVFVEEPKVDQGPDARRIAGQRPLVVSAGVVFVADTIGDHAHQKQRGRVAGIDRDRLFERLGDLRRGVPGVSQHAGTGRPVIGRRLALAPEAIEFLDRLVDFSDQSERLGRGRHAGCGVVAGLPRRLEEFGSLLVATLGHVSHGLVKQRQSAAVCGLQGFKRSAGLPEQSLADAEFHRRSGAAVGRRLEVADGRPEIAMRRGIGAEQFYDRLNFSGAEGAAARDEVADVETCRGNHE